MTMPRASARVTFAPCRCHAIVAPSGSAPTALQSSVRFCTTAAGASSVRIPRLSDANGPSLTPPQRVENATRYGPGAGQSIRSRSATCPLLHGEASRRQLLTRPREQGLARVPLRLLDDVAQQLLQCLSELGAGLEPELDQVAPVHRKVPQPMGLPALALDQAPKATNLLDVLEWRRPVRAALPEEVGFLVVEELECELIAVLREEAARAHRVVVPDLEHVVADDAAHAVAQCVRIPEAAQRLPRELRAHLLVAVAGGGP